MNATTQITGMLPAIIIISAVLTAGVSAFLLRLYKRATMRSMAKETGNDVSSSNEKQTATTSYELEIETITEDSSQTLSSGVNFARLQQSLKSLITVYSSGGTAYALFMTMAYMIMMGEGIYIGRFLWLLIF